MNALIIAIFIALISEIKTDYVNQGESHTFECSLENTTKCKFIKRYRWDEDDDGSTHTILDRNNTKYNRFTIRNSENCIVDLYNSQAIDSSTFVCIIDNNSRYFHLDIIVEPSEQFMSYNGQKYQQQEILLPPFDEYTARFQCHYYQGSHIEKIKWYVNGVLRNTSYKSEVKNQTNQIWTVVSTLEINLHNVNNVKCVINNWAKANTFTATFAYISSSVNLTETSKIKGQIILVDELKEITCETDGLPYPEILIKTRMGNNEWNVVANQYGHLLKYNVSDSGIYVCDVQYRALVDTRLDKNMTSKGLIFINYEKDQEMLRKVLSNHEKKLAVMDDKLNTILKLLHNELKLKSK